jgi:putative Ca2+/H+ antiporter (TMEM165/GDT1 family)
MLSAVLLSLGVVFLAELGDKSQLIAMTYALRHRWWVVLSGVGIAAFLVHGISVAIGHFLGVTLPERPIAFAAAVAFLGFAVWTWREGSADEDEVEAVAEPRFVLLAVISSFVLAELGDKTMLATVALASDHSWAGVWVGATVGMVLADGVAIAAGRLLHKRLPERFLHVLASLPGSPWRSPAASPRWPWLLGSTDSSGTGVPLLRGRCPNCRRILPTGFDASRRPQLLPPAAHQGVGTGSRSSD